MTPIPLVSYLRARPLLLAWAEALGDTLDECPLPTADSWVYFSRWERARLKVGWTRRPSWRPRNCFRPAHAVAAVEPLLLISDAGKNVERMIKLAAERFCVRKKYGTWSKHFRELFPYSSPVLSIVGELRCVAEASFFPNVLAEPKNIRRPGLCRHCTSLTHDTSACPMPNCARERAA